MSQSNFSFAVFYRIASFPPKITVYVLTNYINDSAWFRCFHSIRWSRRWVFMSNEKKLYASALSLILTSMSIIYQSDLELIATSVISWSQCLALVVRIDRNVWNNLTNSLVIYFLYHWKMDLVAKHWKKKPNRNHRGANEPHSWLIC